MLNTYDHIVQVTIKFLRLLKVNVTNPTVNDILQNHPDFPSLLCVSDALNKWNIPNAATRIDDKEGLDELPTPFLAGINESDTPFAVVQSIDDKKVQIFYNNQTKAKSIDRDEFIKQWNRVCLIAEPYEQSGEKEYSANKTKEVIRYAIFAALFTLLVYLSIFFIQHNIITNNIISPLPIYLHYLIILTGVVVSSLLLWYEIDRNNPLLHKVCAGIKKGNCTAILTDKAAKVFGWLSWCEVGFFYFTGGILSLMFFLNSPIPYILNLFALPYIIFSVYYQWRIAKQWCVFCLAVQLLLLLGGVNVIYNNLYINRSIFNFLSLASYLLPVLLWYGIKPYILKQQQNTQLKHEYLRIKFNPEIFEALLKKQKQITEPVDGLGIDIGNPAAEHLIVKVCNPYCGPCAKAHPGIEKLIQENKNLKAKIIFTVSNNPEHIGYKPVAHLLSISAQRNETLTKQALDDWYKAEKKDYESFAVKYPMNGELKVQGNKIEMMSKWCEKLDIQFTPTIFFDGYQLPGPYNIEDLEYFLQQ